MKITLLNPNNTAIDSTMKILKTLSFLSLVASTVARECGEVIATVTKAESEIVGAFFTELVLTGDLEAFRGVATSTFLSSVDYDFQVIKVCGSCMDIDARFEGEDFLNQFADYAAYGSYCGTDTYGYNATHSGLLFLPIDDDGIPISGKLRTLLVEHQAEITITDVPSISFPSSISAYFSSGGDPALLGVEFQNFIEGVVAAASGAVVVLPDNLGFAESFPDFVRAPYLPEIAMQSGVVTFFAADDYIQNKTGGCTLLDRVITLSGSSEGGYDVIPMATAFQRLGFRILNVFSIAAPLDSQTNLQFLFETYFRHFAALQTTGTSDVITDTTLNQLFQVLLPYIGALTSSDTPGYENTNTDQKFVRDEFLTGDQDARKWLLPPSPLTGSEILSVTPVPAIDMANEDLYALFQEAFAAGISDPCESELALTKNVNFLCATLKQMSVWEALKTVSFPVSISYSNDDTLISPNNFPAEIFANENVTEVKLLFNGLLPVSGDHIQAIFAGQLNTVSYFTVTAAASDDGANKITNLTSTEQGVCLGKDESGSLRPGLFGVFASAAASLIMAAM